MLERNADMELLALIGDVGVPEPLQPSITRTARAALEREIEANASPRGPRLRRRLARRSVLLPSALLLTTAVAAAATGLVPLPGMLDFARRNVSDPALTLFRKSIPYQGGTVSRIKDGKATIVPYKETVIPSSVRMVATPAVPGVGAVQFWAGDTKQHGYCTALRLPDGSWAGLKNFKQVGGAIPGCQPTRRQVGWGALIISGFDDTDAAVLTSSGRELILTYGQIVAPGHPTRVHDRYSGATAPLIDGRYFLIVTHATASGDGDADLVALNTSGKVVADEQKPLPGTPTTKCVGRYNVHRVPVPGTKRTSLTWSCRRYVPTIAK
jgi:hypothetical protein